VRFLIFKMILTSVLSLSMGRVAFSYDPEDEVVRRERDLDRVGVHTGRPSPVPEVLPGNLPDLVALGLHRSPRLRARFEGIKQGLHRARVVGSLADPKLSFGVFLEKVETRVGPQESVFALSQFFPLGDKRHLAQSREIQAVEALWQGLLVERLKLIYGITETFYEIAYVQKFVRITRENINLLTQLEGVARTAFEVSMGAQMDLIRMQTEIGKLENDLESRRDQVDPLESQLRSLLDVPSETHLADLILPDTEGLTLTAVAMESALLADSPELKSLDEGIRRDEIALLLEKKSYIPDLNVTLQTVRTGEAIMPVRGSGKDPVSLMFSINLPIKRGRLRSQVQAAQSQLEAAREGRKDRKNSLIVDLHMALFKLRDARRRIDLYVGSLVPKAEQAFQVAQTSYMNGVLDFLSVIDAERTLLEFQRSVARATSDHEQGRARVEMLVGTRLGESTEQESGTTRSQAPSQ